VEERGRLARFMHALMEDGGNGERGRIDEQEAIQEVESR